MDNRNISVDDPNKLAADGEEIVNTANNFLIWLINLFFIVSRYRPKAVSRW